MTSFKVFGKLLTEVEISAIKGLISQAGCAAEVVSIVDAIDDPDPKVDDEVILVLGTPAVCADPATEANLAKSAASGARRAIWIWPESAETAALPPSAAKYSYSVIPWDPSKLRLVAADDDHTCFETPAGKPLPKVHTERNVCVEEEELK